MCHHHSRNYRIIRVMFWAFPYLLWQAFGHWSGFVVGVIVAVMLTTMFNNLFYAGSAAHQQAAEPQPRLQEMEEYQRGYRAEARPDYAEPDLYPAREPQPQYEEMQVSYPEMPPVE